MSSEREKALLSMELLDAAEDLLRRFQSYNNKCRPYSWAARIVKSLNEEKQRQLLRHDGEKP